MGKQKIPVRALTIFLAKEGVNRETLMDLAKRAHTHTKLQLNVSTAGDLFTYATASHHPVWTSFFGDAIDAKALGLWTSSASAVLLVERGNRLFAVTFGYGRHAVRPEAVEGTFGLRVALNVLARDAIRSIDRKTFEGVTTHVREQASKVTTLSAFGINADRDLLRAVVGEPSDQAYGARLFGMDALSTAVRVRLDELPTLLDRYLVKASDTSYRAEYAWIDNIAEVRDPKLVDKLRNKLVDEILAGNMSRKWLAVPDLLEWRDIEGFRYGRSDRTELHSDIHFNSYLSAIRDPAGITWDRMKVHRVRCFSSSTSQVIHDWSLSYCIYAEIEHDDGYYILNGGSWFQIDTGYVSRLEKELETIPPTSVSLVHYKDGESEAKYNKRLAVSLRDACVMDAKLIPFGGGHSSVEYCDVLTSKRVLYHVKKYRGSSVLSHLFAQGMVSGTALVSDAEFRKTLNKKLPSKFRLDNPIQRPQARHYEIAYVIPSRSASDLVLPFFSRVTLRNALQQLGAFGFKVTLTKVAIE